MPNPTSKLNLVINGTTTQLDIHDANAVDLNSNQTVAGNKEFTGTTTAHDLVPSATDTYNFGSSTAQWNNAYIKSLTINGVACGDILTHNASEFAYDANVVHKSGDETIRGNKHFNGNYVDVNAYRFRIKNVIEVAGELSTAENPWTGNRWSGFNFVDKNNARTFEISRGAIRNGWTFVNLGVLNNASNTWLEFLKYEGDSSVSYASSIDFVPLSDNTYELGTSARKWKSFNGINPGALSLPNISNTGANAWIALDTTNWVKNVATSSAQKYTPLADGWLNVRVDNAVALGLALTDGGNYMHQMVRSETPNSLALLLPVFKNKEVAILVAGNENLSYNRATFYPCQGNV